MNLLLIVADALRADHLSCYGYRRYTTPFIDLIAETGCTFRHAFAASNSTDPCFTSLMTGRYPVSHGITGMYGPERHDRWLEDATPVLAELLQSQGFHTAAVDSLRKWFKRGFDKYILPDSGEKLANIAGAVFNGDAITDAALAWADTYRADRPYFLFLHYWDTHAPYQPPTRYSRLFEADALWEMPLRRKVYVDIVRNCASRAEEVVSQVANYDRELAYMDTEVERLVAGLHARGMMDETALIFTANHGESFYEHDVMFTHYHLHDPTVHIPLIISAPGVLPGGKQVSGLASQVDLLPTILELAEIEPPPGLQGESLISAARRGRTGREFVHLEEGSHQRTRAIRASNKTSL